MPALLLSLLLFASSAISVPASAEGLPEEFSPTLQDGNIPLLQPGTTINSSNLDQYTHWLDESVIARIRANEYQITLGPTLNFPTHPRYVEATASHVGETRIGAEPGELLNYLAGRPMPSWAATS
jgi:hypothetical protein